MYGSDQLNHRIVFELKPGCTKEDTIIEIGQAKALSLIGTVNRFRRNGKPTPDLVELSSFSRRALRNRNNIEA